MEKALIVKTLCELLLDDKKSDCIDFANTHYPFEASVAAKRNYSRYDQCRVFLRDGFKDRYSGEKLLFPGLIMLLSIELPEIFKYHKNWKMSETHLVYWQLFPTIDHVIPVARGGKDIEENWITTSMIRNAAKANWTTEELGWKVHSKGDLNNWDGLASCFLELYEKYPLYSNNSYIKSWRRALLKAREDITL